MWLLNQQNDFLSHLVMWRNPRDSGIAFGSGLVFLLAVRYVSLLSVVGNLFLALITATMAFRIYKSVLAAVNKNNDGHPFKKYLDSEVRFSTDKVQQTIDSLTNCVNTSAQHLKKIFLIDNVIESIKFAAYMYFLIVLGRWINGLTLVTLMWVLYFSAPKIYADNQKTIDDALMPIKQKIDEVMGKLKANMPVSSAAVDNKKKE